MVRDVFLFAWGLSKYSQMNIDACAEAGGGRVIISNGVYMTDTIVLKSDVNLHFEESGLSIISKVFIVIILFVVFMVFFISAVIKTYFNFIKPIVFW